MVMIFVMSMMRRVKVFRIMMMVMRMMTTTYDDGDNIFCIEILVKVIGMPLVKYQYNKFLKKVIMSVQYATRRVLIHIIVKCTQT